MKINALGIFLTRKCNFRCTYCCTETGIDPPDKMTFNELKNVSLQAISLGAGTLVIPGEGEPFLDKNLLPFIDFASENGLGVTVFTNGSIIDKKTADHLFKKRVTIVFKLHSLEESVYDTLAGKNEVVKWNDFSFASHKKVTRIPSGLKYLLQAGYGGRNLPQSSRAFLCIETVVLRQNIKHIPDIARFCKELGIGCKVETLIKVNRADQNASKLAVAEEKELELYYKLRKILGWKFALTQKRRCGFETDPFLDISGNIRHCFSIAANIGNIRDMTLYELHKKEQRVRKKAGMMNKRYALNHRGFLFCASRKIINNAL